jgi:hypothetical protein
MNEYGSAMGGMKKMTKKVAKKTAKKIAKKK